MILWGERLTAGPRGAHAARALLNLAGAPGPARPRGRRAAGDPRRRERRAACARPACSPTPGPGLADRRPPRARPRHDGRASPQAGGRRRAGRAVSCCTSTRCARCPAAAPGRAALEQGHDGRGARRRSSPTGCASTRRSCSPPSPTPRRRARVTHPDGRVQRLRPAIGRPGDVRAEWQVLADLERPPGPRPRRADRRHGLRAALRRRALLRRADARRARRARRALARARGGRATWPQADAGPFGLDRPPPRRRRRTGAAPRHVPLDLGRRPRSRSPPR